MQIQRINKSYCMTEQHKIELEQVLRVSLGDTPLAEYVYLAFELGASFQNSKEKKVPVLLQKMD